MAHAIFNVSPLKILSSFQYNIHTMSTKRQKTIANQQKSPVTFEITVPAEESNISLATNPIDIPGSSASNYHRIQLNDYDLTTDNMDMNVLTEQDDLAQFANSLNQSSYAAPTDELAVFFDGLAVQSPTGSCLYSPQQIYSPLNIGSPQSPTFLSASQYLIGSPQSPSFLNANQSFAGSPQSPSFLNTNTVYGSPGSPFLNTNTVYGSPANQTNSYINDLVDQGNSGYMEQIHSGNSYVGSPSNPVCNGSYVGSPAASNVQSYMGSPNSHHLLNSPIINKNDDINNTLGLSSYLSPITTPSPTSSYAGPSSFLSFPPNPFQEPQYRPTSPSPADVILTTAEVNQYYQSQPQHSDVVEPISPQIIQPQKKTKKSTVKSTTPSGRKAKIHQCPYCHHTSNRANNMREHIQIHDPNRPKPHTCKLCRKSFARKHDMNRHVLTCKNSKKKRSVT